MEYFQSNLIVYWLYILTVISLWIPLGLIKRDNGSSVLQWWHIPLGVMLVVAVVEGLLEFVALPVIAGFYFVCWLSTRSLKPAWLNVVVTIGLVIFGLAMGFTLFPGFADSVSIMLPNESGDIVQQDYRFNISKYFIGLFFVGLMCTRISTLAQLRDMLVRVAPVIGITVLLVFSSAMLIGLVGFDPHISSQLLLWAVSNLFLVCVTEEAFFRLFIQQRLTTVLNRITTYGTWIALVITSVFFGVVHFAFGWQYVIIATIAGLGYGMAYIRTGRIEAAILTHFLVNLIHFTLFTYPTME